MITFGFHTSCQVILGLALYISISSSHTLDGRFADLSATIESFHDSVYARDANQNDSTYHNPYASSEISKRGLYNLGQNSPSDASILQQAYWDMVEVVTFVAANPNPQVMARYFSPADAADVSAIFNTVRLMAQPGGFPDPPAGVLPIWTDLSSVTVIHKNGIKELGTLAESEHTNIGITTGQTIYVYNFGWKSLWQRLLGDLQCARDIGPKTNYKLHFLGTLLLHETLHFDSVTFLVWGVGTGAQYLDDQAGNFPCLSKAYGPWEAIELLRRDPTLAKINIENYVWYALPSSPLFTKLPLEIREHIYELVLGGDIIHLVDVSQRIAHYRYAHNEVTKSQDPPTGTVPLQNPLGPRAPPTVTWLDERNHIPRPAQFSSGSLSLPLTCHAVYAEAMPILYRHNTFSMASPLVLIYLKDYVLRPWHFAEIRHLCLNPWVRFDSPAHFGGRVPALHDAETLARFWGVVAGMELRTLGAWIEFWGKEKECGVEAGWVRPMLDVAGVNAIGLSIERRISLYKRRRLSGLEAEIEKRWTRA